MLAAWSEGAASASCAMPVSYGLSPWKSAAALQGISRPTETQKPANRHRSLGVIGVLRNPSETTTSSAWQCQTNQDSKMTGEALCFE